MFSLQTVCVVDMIFTCLWFALHKFFCCYYKKTINSVFIHSIYLFSPVHPPITPLSHTSITHLYHTLPSHISITSPIHTSLYTYLPYIHPYTYFTPLSYMHLYICTPVYVSQYTPHTHLLLYMHLIPMSSNHITYSQSHLTASHTQSYLTHSTTL